MKEELQEIFDEQKTLRKNRTSAKQAYNDRNTVGMVDKELGEHYKNFNNLYIELCFMHSIDDS